MKIILTTPTPHTSKKYDPKICHKMRGRMASKSLEIKGLSQRMWCTNRLLWHTNSDFYGVRTPPFMPYEPFSLGVGVVFNLWNLVLTHCCAQRWTYRHRTELRWNEILATCQRDPLGRNYPPTRNYYENNSLRIIFRIFEDFELSECPGKKDIFKELRVRFVIFPKIIISK